MTTQRGRDSWQPQWVDQNHDTVAGQTQWTDHDGLRIVVWAKPTARKGGNDESKTLLIDPLIIAQSQATLPTPVIRAVTRAP